MPMFTYVGQTAREYPFPPIARVLTPGELVELEPDEVPDDGRFQAAPTPAPPAPAAASTAAKPAKATKAAKASDKVEE